MGILERNEYVLKDTKIQNLNPRSSYSRDFCSADLGPVPVRLSIAMPDADSRCFEGT